MLNKNEAAEFAAYVQTEMDALGLDELLVPGDIVLYLRNANPHRRVLVYAPVEATYAWPAWDTSGDMLNPFAAGARSDDCTPAQIYRPASREVEVFLETRVLIERALERERRKARE